MRDASALRARADLAWEAAERFWKACICWTPSRMAIFRSRLATSAAERMAYSISFFISARADLDCRARASTEALVSSRSLEISVLSLLLTNQRVSLSILAPRFSTSWARFSPLAMAARMEWWSSFLLASSRAAISRRPLADLAALAFTTPVRCSIFLSALASFLRTTTPSLWILWRNMALVLRTWSMASRRMRRVAAAMAAFFLACWAWFFQRAAQTPEVPFLSLFSACLRSLASWARTEARAWLKDMAMRFSLRSVSA